MTDLRRGISGLNVGLWLVFLLIHSPGSHAGSPCWTIIPQNESYIITCPENEVLAPRQINSGPLNFEYIGQKAWELKTSHFQFPDLQYFQQSVPNFINNMQCIQSHHIYKFCPSEHEGPHFYTEGQGCGFVSGCNSTESDLACPDGGCNITIEGGSGKRIYTQVYIQSSQYRPYHQETIGYINYIIHPYNKAVIPIPQGLRNPRFIIGYEISDYSDKKINSWIHVDCWQRKGLVDGSEQPAHECVSGPDLESSTQQTLTFSHNSESTIRAVTPDKSEPAPSTPQMHMNLTSPDTLGKPEMPRGLSAESKAGIITGGIVVALLLLLVIIVLIILAKQGRFCTRPSGKTTYPDLNASRRKEENIYEIDDSPVVDGEYVYDEALPVGKPNNVNLDHSTGVLGHPTATSNNNPIPDSERENSSVNSVVLYDNSDYESADEIPPPLPPRGT